MRSWYEFGYNGFPTGEQRRRFYRQRDDPCDSEEERDYDDETNDRPIFYYPLRASEEGSRSSYDSAFSSVSSCASEAEAEAEAGNNANADGHASQLRCRRGRRSRRTTQTEASERCVLHSTLYEDTPAWYGATAVALAAPPSIGAAAGDVFTLQHGGAPCASPFAISNQASVWRWSPSGSVARDEAPGTLRCTRVRDDATLLSRLRWDRLHPTLRLAHSAAARSPPPRIGHCAVSLATLDSSLLQYFLTDHRIAERAASASSDVSTGRHSLASTGGEVASGLLTDDSVEVYGSLVLGGTSQLLHASGGGFSYGCQSSASLPRAHESSETLQDTFGGVFASASSPTAALSQEPSLDGVVVPHTAALSHPTLCITLLQRVEAQVELQAAEAGRVPPRQYTVFFPLDTLSMSIAAPRAFATLTPWSDESAEAAAVRCFAYIGGTENGRDPPAALELEVFRLHLETWAWSCNPVTTYGAKPTPRFGHSANMVDEDKCLLIFGGVGAGHVYLNDLHVLDVRTLVWREVFLPFSLEVPRRAFHMSTVLTRPLTVAERRENTPVSSIRPPLSAFTAQARAALQRGDLLGGSAEYLDTFLDGDGRIRSDATDCGEVGTAGDAADDVDDVWSTSVTTARSRCTILFLGGENDGGRAVAASWACALCNGKWQRLSFPFRTLAPFFHVGRSAAGGGTEVQHVRRQLPRREFRTTVESLVERSARTNTAASGSTVPPTLPDDSYVAACHGSLAQLLLFPRTAAEDAERLVLVGGSRGPPVSVATQLEVINASLKNSASLWLLAAHQQCSLFAAVQQRVPLLPHFFFRSGGALAQAVISAFQPDGAAAPASTERQRRPLSEADIRANRLISESVLDGQLSEWLRLARKRLRESE